MLDRIGADVGSVVAGKLPVRQLAAVEAACRRIGWVRDELVRRLIAALVADSRVSSLRCLDLASELGLIRDPAVWITSRVRQRLGPGGLEAAVPTVCQAMAGYPHLVLSEGWQRPQGQGAGRRRPDKIHVRPNCRLRPKEIERTTLAAWSDGGMRRRMCRQCFRYRPGSETALTVFSGANTFQIMINERRIVRARARVVAHLRGLARRAGVRAAGPAAALIVVADGLEQLPHRLLG